MAGLGIGAAAYLAFAGPNLFQTLGGYDPQIEDFLQGLEPLQVALAGVKDQFTDITETTAGPMSEAFHMFEAASIDAQSGVLVLGDELDIVNGTIAQSVLVFDQATGTWQSSNVTMTHLMERMRQLDRTTDMSTDAIARMVAVEAGLPSINDELAASYSALGRSTSALSKMSTAAAGAINKAAGSVISADLELRRQLGAGEITGHDFRKAQHALDHYQHGTDWVPVDGPAYLHRGEAVLTAEENQMRGDALIALATHTKKTADILKRIEKTGLPTSSRTGVYG
jgi:hypothetical protein